MKVIELNITNKIIQLPNIITLLRIAGSLGLLLCDVTDVAFWIIYALCGISDIADGWLARKLKCVTRTGALLDSVADICFVACCAWKLLPILELPQWLWLWAGVIVAIKVVNQLSALVMYGRCCFPHTLANKWAGFLLFITVPMTLWSIAPISIATIVATFAAIHEGHYIRMNKIKMKERFKFNTVGLFTRDNKATVDFYTKTFGFTTDWDGIQPNVEMMLGNMRIILYPRSDFEQMVSYKFQYSMGLNGTAELAFDVPSYADVDKEYQHALANGAASVLPPTTEPWGQRTCYVADPDGNLIEIGSFNE